MWKTARDISAKEVKAVCGRVENPDNILNSDTRWCTIGNDNIIMTINSRDKKREKSTINILFEEEQ